MNYLDLLDDSQRAAVEYIGGPSLVIAGAGAGKTRVLTTKAAYLIDRGMDPQNILALTFTNKAAREMRERISAIAGDDAARRLQMGTFHSVFARILRAEAERVGCSPRFTIYDRSDSTSLVRLIIKESGLDEKKYNASSVLSRISRAKNRLVLPDGYAGDPALLREDSAAGVPETARIYALYQNRLKAAGAMDFDDILMYMFLLLDGDGEARRKYEEGFRFVLVDEYQDTNTAQARILGLLARRHQKICAVGDDAQSIYAFRGAEIDNILNFTQAFPAAKVYKLERNYRSTQTIVDAANSVISRNRRRIPKDVYSLAERGERIRIREAYSDLEEAGVVTRQIAALSRQGMRYGDTAVLYRVNSQSRALEESLRKEGIPYKVVGGQSFYEREEIKDVTACFRLAVNPDDEEAFRRVVKRLASGIGGATLSRISAAAAGRNISLWRAAGGLTAEELGVSRGMMRKIASFAAMIRGFASLAEEADAYTLGLRVIEESGVRKEADGGMTMESLSRQENLQELLNALNTFVENTVESEGSRKNATIDRYLSDIALLTTADKGDDSDDKVTLMTIHAAKGLEFGAVFIVGMEEGVFPGAAAVFSDKELEEERRLFYVALTRAKSRCFISYAHSRFLRGETTYPEPSRFLGEIDGACVTREGAGGRTRGFYGAAPWRGGIRRGAGSAAGWGFRSWAAGGGTQGFRPFHAEKAANAADGAEEDAPAALQEARTRSGEVIRAGQAVEHPRFGRGKVLSITDAGDTAKVSVAFENAGCKDLLLKFAPLTAAD